MIVVTNGCFVQAELDPVLKEELPFVKQVVENASEPSREGTETLKIKALKVIILRNITDKKMTDRPHRLCQKSVSLSAEWN